jgi:hypothetical protein
VTWFADVMYLVEHNQSGSRFQLGPMVARGSWKRLVGNNTTLGVTMLHPPVARLVVEMDA